MKPKICLFDGKATPSEIMTTNGKYILDPICTMVKIKEVLNIDYSVRLMVEIADEYKEAINFIAEDKIIRVSDEEGDEPFRIVNIRKSKKSIEVFAVHVTIRDIINMWLEDVRPENQSGNGALNWIFSNAKGGHNFNLSSNITNLNTAYYMDMNVYNALYGADNCFLNRWGGETRRRGFNITINDKIGSDRGMQIRSKKNLTGFEATTNVDDLTTVLYVKGYDGIKLDQPVTSPLLNTYSKPYYKEVKYDDIKVKSENDTSEGYDTIEQARAEMKRRALLEFSKNNIDVIKATYNVNFAQLEKTEEYKEYSMIETCFLGDTVEVIEDNFNVNIKVRVIEREYDVLAEKRTSTVLSNQPISKPVKIEDILKELEKGKNPNGQPNLAEYINSMITSGFKDSYVVLKPNELLIMDSKDINTAKNVTRYNKNGLGFSQTGYFGNYTYGFTIDGKINASLITTGTMTADRIKGGILESLDGSLQIDLRNTVNGIQFKENGIKAIDIKGHIINFHDWEGTTRTTPSGKIFSSRGVTGTNSPGLTITHGHLSRTTISHQLKDGTYSNYMEFDIDKVTGVTSPITVYEETDFQAQAIFRNRIDIRAHLNLNTVKVYGESERQALFVENAKEFGVWKEDGKSIFWVKDGDFVFRKNGVPYLYKDSERDRIVFGWDVWGTENAKFNKNMEVIGEINTAKVKFGNVSIYGASSNRAIISGAGEFAIYGLNDRSMFSVGDGNFVFRRGGDPYFFKSGTNETLVSDWDFQVNKNLHVNKNFTVSGSKNCIQNTENYGDRLYYATEDTECLLTDTGKAVTSEFNGTYEAVVLIDNIFKESVDLSDYYVFLTKYGRGDIWIKEQTKDYFIIESENSIKFNWKIEAKRKGFEDKRLEEYFDVETEVIQEKTINPNCGIMN